MPSYPPLLRAVVTGAASGLGRAIALELASRGGRLALGDIDEAGLDETVALAARRGAAVESLRCDVRDADQVEALVALADEAFGGVDIGVNNAGVAVSGHVGDIPLDDWRWQIDINLWGVIYGCHSMVPRMKRQGSGWILNVASAAGLISAPMMAPYNVTKAAVVALSETMAGELHGTDVRVSALCPTFFRTNIHVGSRTSVPDLADQTVRLVTESKWSAEQVAKIALAGLERGDLYIIPQTDGKVMWRAKRLLGQSFYGAMGRVMKSPRVVSWLGGEE